MCNQFQISSADVWSTTIDYCWPLADLTSNVVKWIVTVVVVDQYYSSVRPRPRAVESPTLGANCEQPVPRRSCISWLGTTPRRAKSYVVAIWIASVLFIIPQFSPIVYTVPYFFIYETSLKVLLMILPPFALTSIYICRTVITYRKPVYCCTHNVIHSTSGPPRSKSSSNSSVVASPPAVGRPDTLDVTVVDGRSKVGTRVVAILGLVFLICRLLSLVIYFISIVDRARHIFTGSDVFYRGASFDYLLTSSNFLIVLNSATRFVRYFYVEHKLCSS